MQEQTKDLDRGALLQCSEEARLQPIPGHVEHRRHHLRRPLWPVPLQRGRGHRGPDQERPVHVPHPAVEVDLEGGGELHPELVGRGARGEVHGGRRPPRPLGV